MKISFTVQEILAAAKSAGLIVTRAAAKLNGSVVYKIVGKPGLWTRIEIARLAGLAD